jgi:hypothetical protein
LTEKRDEIVEICAFAVVFGIAIDIKSG